MTETNTAEPVLISKDKGVLTATFNRPGKKNALTHVMYEKLVETLARAESEPNIRVLCFRGAERCFTSGNDLMDFLTNPPSDENSPVLRFIHDLIDFKKPLVAAVEGPAVGIGTTMLLHCDLVYASDTAKFQMPFTKLALCPEAASSALLPRIVGLQRATELLFLNRILDAETARQWGLITECIPEADFDAVLEQRLEAITLLPPEALRATKALLRQPLAAAAHEAARQEALAFAQRLSSAEAAESMQAFLERRPPDFSKFV